MRLIRLTSEYIDELIDGSIGNRGPKLPPCALTLGSFDGLHRGHQALIHAAQAARARLGLEAAAIWTFKQHPRLVLEKDPEPFLLTTWREKLSVLAELGCKTVVAADFCPQLSRLDYRTFVERFLVDYLGMKHLVAGCDTHLGHHRLGTVATLGELGRELGFGLEVMEAVRDGQEIVSSSAIRAALAAGDPRRAARMLGRPYALWGQVVPGDGRGRTIGYPTANIEALDPMKLLPAGGVYAVRVSVPSDAADPGSEGVLDRVAGTLPEVDRDGQLLSVDAQDWTVFGGMLNFGHVPTFNPDGLAIARIEAHLLKFAGDLRGRIVKVDWVERLRPERKFSDVAELTAQLAKDADAARDALAS